MALAVPLHRKMPLMNLIFRNILTGQKPATKQQLTRWFMLIDVN